MHAKYKNMLKAMLKNSSLPRDAWFIYILQCADNSFYTGITKDLTRRLKMHNSGKASRYTRTRRPVLMIYNEEAEGRANALVRECAIKAMSRASKERLINGKEPKCRVYSPKSSKAKSRVKKLPKTKII